MRTEIQKIGHLKQFFSIININDKNITYSYKTPSKILLQNIQRKWLQFVYAKTCQHFPVYLNKSHTKMVDKNKIIPYGYISTIMPQLNEQYNMECILDDTSLKTTSELSLNIVVLTEEISQYYMQWQRYRKYWWSSITTTPGLFTLSDIKNKNNKASVNITANFDCGSKIVETISINTESNSKTSCLKCKMPIEDALLTLLLDGLSNSTKKEYLRIHNEIAPYKIALALDYQDSTDLNTLKELATLMIHKLEVNNISTRCPNVLLPLELQLKENFRIGVTYTAIINESTLSNGRIYLLNSSTMLKEHLHLADFESYATLLCGK